MSRAAAPRCVDAAPTGSGGGSLPARDMLPRRVYRTLLRVQIMTTRASHSFVFIVAVGCHEAGPKDTGDTSDTSDTTDTGVDTGLLPPCTSGSTFVTWTRDGGATLAPMTGAPAPNTYTWSITIPADDPLTLLVENNGTLWRSLDAGCTFTALATLSDPWWSLTSAPDGRTWGYVANGSRVLYLEGDDVTEGDGPGGALFGMVLDPLDPTHVRVGAELTLYERVGAGGWEVLGGPGTSESAYVWAFDPTDIDRAIVGMTRDGIWTTHDGGRRWAHAEGFDDRTNIYAAVWSPIDPEVVWAEGINMDESDAGAPSGGRHVWRSTDGGASFTPVVDQGGDVILPNGVPMVADPVDADVVWFTFGSPFQGEGTRLYRYDAGTGLVTSERSTDWHGYQAMTFSPADPALLYLAVLLEQID